MFLFLHQNVKLEIGLVIICNLSNKTHIVLSNARDSVLIVCTSPPHSSPFLLFSASFACFSMVRVFLTFRSHLPATACRLLCGFTWGMLLCMKRTGPYVPQLISDTARWILRYCYLVGQVTCPDFADPLGYSRKMLHFSWNNL
jgi:hypothetical protein